VKKFTRYICAQGKGKIKVVPFAQLIKHYTMKAYGGMDV
jgi:hypothetical protein